MSTGEHLFNELIGPIRDRMIRTVGRIVADPHDAADTMPVTNVTMWCQYYKEGCDVVAFTTFPKKDPSYATVDAIEIGRTNIVVDWYGTTYLDLQVQCPVEDAVTNTIPDEPHATCTTYRVWGRLKNKHGRDIKADVAVCEDGQALWSSCMQGDLDLSQGFIPGSYQLLLSPPSVVCHK